MRQIFLLIIIMTMTACATIGRHPIAGTWDITIAAQRGENTGVLVVNEDMTGVLTGSRGRVTEIEDITYEDGQLAFTMMFNVQGRELAMSLSATVEGDTLQGVLTTPMRDSTVTATRRPLE
jgi:hypothetical protein